ncbi:hypothetical protein PoB_005315900 [Plakobranchus ocellatus]|uniref:Uncharacterized protein n=1 Tax=Plakobranchus ocellatus TaxID=259542 RepID=A0AAV4C7H5_9GAST|nr:hypothetical protein PoB_005315900 [Plakobranchus ocellatus]
MRSLSTFCSPLPAAQSGVSPRKNEARVAVDALVVNFQLHQSRDPREGRRDITEYFSTNLPLALWLFSSSLWELLQLRCVHSFMLSSHCLISHNVSCCMVLAMLCDHVMCPYLFSLYLLLKWGCRWLSG